MFRTPRVANVLLLLAAAFGLGLLVSLVVGTPYHLLTQGILGVALVVRAAAEWGHAQVWHLRRQQTNAKA